MHIINVFFFYFLLSAHKVTLSMGVFAQLTQLKFHPAAASVHSGAVLQVELTLRCLMPVSVRIQQLVASIHFEVDHGGTHGRSKGAQRRTHPGTVVFRQSNSSAGPPSSAGTGPSLELDEIQDRSPSDNSLNSTGVICKNTHLLMRRHDSNSPPDTPNCISPPTVGIKEGAQMLKVQDVTLEPGNNSITFTAPVRCDLPSVIKCLFNFSPLTLSFVPLVYIVEWTARYLHTSSAVCHSRWGAVYPASYLPVGPIWSLFSGAPAHRGASLRSEYFFWLKSDSSCLGLLCLLHLEFICSFISLNSLIVFCNYDHISIKSLRLINSNKWLVQKNTLTFNFNSSIA